MWVGLNDGSVQEMSLSTHTHDQYALTDHTHSQYANSSHTHTASAITNGILPLTRGGTGVTSISELQTLLGITQIQNFKITTGTERLPSANNFSIYYGTTYTAPPLFSAFGLRLNSSDSTGIITVEDVNEQRATIYCAGNSSCPDRIIWFAIGTI